MSGGSSFQSRGAATLNARSPSLSLGLVGLVASYDIWPGNRVGLFWDTTHTRKHRYLLNLLFSQTHMRQWRGGGRV